jgi:small subunit ribosomal protein S1
MSTESFAALFEESVKKFDLKSGSVVTGKIIAIDPESVTVNVGLKSEGMIPIEQFKSENGDLEPLEIGQEIIVVLEALEDGWGETRLSREKAKRHQAWLDLGKALENNESVIGFVSGKVKGGFTVELKHIRAFLPGSLVDIRPMRESVDLEGQELEFKVIKLDQKRNNVVVSRRSVVESEGSQDREELLNSLKEGQELAGVVKNLTEYGAFVDLGGIDGLLHITDMAWRRVKHPSEVVEVGQELQVKILKFDREKSRVSLGLKQLGADPWVSIQMRYPEGMRLSGKVTNVTDYGCFVELEEGVEGLVHVSEMDWTNKNIHPSKVVQLGLEVDVMVLDIDEERRRISLGLKQCKDNPWDAFANRYSKGDKIQGTIKSITDFGIFIGLDGGIDGLIHLSDISWQESAEDIIRQYKRGDEIEALVLVVDPERERISLGIKQLESDPYTGYMTENTKGMIVKGRVAEVNARGATIILAEGVEGYLKAAEISTDKVDDATHFLKENDEVEAKIIGVDKKSRIISLSIKAKDIQEEKDVLKEFSKNSGEAGGTTLGDIFKQQMGDSADK